MASWIDYWNSDHPIYVNQRHLVLHYRTLAEDIAALIPAPDAAVLDYGCGEALSAARIASACNRLLLVDSAPTIREKLKARFEGLRGIEVLSPEDATALPAGILDLVIVHSVAQYVAKPDFAALIETLAGKLKPGGSLILGDILPNGLRAWDDVEALLIFGWRGGFLLAACLGLVRTALSDYRKIRSQLGLTHYDEAEVMALLEKAGMTASRLDENLGHNQARMAFRGVKRAENAA
jgi:SAM-dependent methyltransferase